MYNIVVCCLSGLSSSILVHNMKQSAKEKGINCLIWTVGEQGLELAYGDADVILLAPQVRDSILPKLEAKTGHFVPYVSIDNVDYGKMDGEKVLEAALNAIKK